MRKILFLLSITEFFSVLLYANIIDTLSLYNKGNYILSYAHIRTIQSIKPDTLIQYLVIDSVNGIITLKKNLNHSVTTIIDYSSYDTKILLRHHTFNPNARSFFHIDSTPINKINYGISKQNRNFVNGLNVLNFNLNDYNGFNVNTAADNHFNYHSPGGITVNGYINDNNRIFSGEGAYLSDISGFNIFIGKENKSINLGDISYELNGLNQKMIGCNLKYGNKLQLLAGLDGGERGNTEIIIKENSLGPYNILSSSDSLYYLSPHSEKVFLNGNVLKSGTDYTIDYTYGTISLLPKIKLNEGDKLYITYQLKSRYNIRHYIHLSANTNRYFSVYYDETRDWARNIFGISYDSIISYNDSTITLSGVKFAGTNKGDYIKSGDHYTYAGYKNGDYICHFTYVGDSAGEYIYDNDIHGFAYKGAGNGDYLPVIIVRPPALKRSISIKGNYKEINSSITLLQNKNNLILGKYNYNSTGIISYKKKIESDKESITIIPSLGWFQNILSNDFFNRIAKIKSSYNIITPDSFKNILLSDLFLNYEYKNILSLKSHSSELLRKKIITTNSLLILKLNRYIHTSYTIDYISPSTYNLKQLMDRYSVRIGNQQVRMELFRKNTYGDSFNISENGVSISNSTLLLSIYKKFHNECSSINYDLFFNSKNSILRAYIEAHDDTLTSQFDVQLSRRLNQFYISVKGNGGNYKPYFLIPQFIESTNGDYDYDSLNNVYYRSENGHFIKKLVYRQYERPLNSYDIDFNIHSTKLFTFKATINAKRNYIQDTDTIQKNDRYEFNGLLNKKFNNNSCNLNLILIRSNLVLSKKVLAELLFRREKSELYKINFNYSYYSDNTPYLQSLKSDLGGLFSYSNGLFNIKLFGNYIEYTIPERQNIFNYGTELTYSIYIINSRFTFTPILNYNLYGYDNHFGEIDQNYPKGVDAILKLNVQHNLSDNTKLNFDANMRYNEVKGFIKNFNLSVGIDL